MNGHMTLFLEAVRAAPHPGATWPYLLLVWRDKKLAPALLPNVHRAAQGEGLVYAREVWSDGKRRDAILLTQKGWRALVGTGGDYVR